ncbi:MAG TPA: TIGR01244 family sulfur transferase [Allosphingosinicella sp.]|jgi:uncharacterized protein (TIGR01244 family)|nr:TIGR01244 family sulfur transferase [Allosphingosinicella sp.]
MRQLEEGFFVSGQVAVEDVPSLAARGIRTIINNRPDGEVPGQPESGMIGIAAREAGLAYHFLPLSQLNAEAVEATGKVLEAAEGPILAFCAVGARSTYLWALARSSAGADADTLTEQAAAAGYDLAPIRRFMR